MTITDLWYTEDSRIDLSVLGDEAPPALAGAIARPSADSYLNTQQKRCNRCGVVRSVDTHRIPPLCMDCKQVLTKAQRKAWKK